MRYSLLVVALMVLPGCGYFTVTPTKTATAPATPAPAPAGDGPMEYVPANVDTVGTKGRDYGGDMITEPISQYWKQADRLNLMEIEYSLKLYQAEHGEYPATWEDFQTLIVQPTGKPLPSLPQGHEYSYDPRTGKLYVKRPAGTAAAAPQ